MKTSTTYALTIGALMLLEEAMRRFNSNNDITSMCDILAAQEIVNDKVEEYTTCHKAMYGHVTEAAIRRTKEVMLEQAATPPLPLKKKR